VKAYILACNEAKNIGRCLAALMDCDIETVVLDSGSDDETVEIAKARGADVQPYEYLDHCRAYNDITGTLSPTEWCLILDADMVVSRPLIAETRALLESGSEVVLAPVTFKYAGGMLRYASLYPPKAFGFLGGREYFEPLGHGERLRAQVATALTQTHMIHDDRKDYAAFVRQQTWYGQQIIRRMKEGRASMKDRLRLTTPLLALGLPLYILIWKRGFLDGRPGLLYALDRMVAELLIFREGICARLPRGNRDRVS